MRVDLQRTDSWNAVNSVYREALGLGESPLQVQTYPGLKAGLWEICTQLTQLVPNKRTIYYQKEAGPVFESVAVHLSRDGFKVKALTAAELNNPAEWFEAVQKELLFIVELQDEPVTGELYDFPELDKVLADKRVYRIAVSHARHACMKVVMPSTYNVNLMSIRLDHAVAVLGERVRVQPPVASGMVWPEYSLTAARQELNTPPAETYALRKGHVLAIEKALPDGAKAVLAPDANRLYDRAVLTYDDLDGLSLITELAKELNVEIKPPGDFSPLETTSLCRWNDERIWQGLIERGFTPTQLRGLVVISSEIIREGLIKKINEARKRVLASQNG